MDQTNNLDDKIDILTNSVKRVLQVDDVTMGTHKDNYLVRYRGRLYNTDSEAAYNTLAEQVKPMDITPLFRWEGSRHVIILVRGMPKARRSNPWVNLVLFFATFASVMLSSGLTDNLPQDPLQALWAIIVQGMPFAISLMLILAAHEFGHYFAGRFHKVHVSLPYFIPLPLVSPFGTMGAFINMKEIPRNRRVLLDIGIAGPLAGLVVSLPILWIGLMLSKVAPIPQAIPDTVTFQIEGNSIIYLLSKLAIFGQLLPSPAGGYSTISPILYWIRYFFTGLPVPAGGMDVMLHPMAMAGWAGLLVTSMNLIPAGQLDGGHVLYVLFGRKWARRLLPVILIAMGALGFVWNGWWLWAGIIFLMGRAYAEPLDQITSLDTKRKALAVLVLIILFLTFIPVPLNYF